MGVAEIAQLATPFAIALAVVGLLIAAFRSYGAAREEIGKQKTLAAIAGLQGKEQEAMRQRVAQEPLPPDDGSARGQM